MEYLLRLHTIHNTAVVAPTTRIPEPATTPVINRVFLALPACDALDLVGVTVRLVLLVGDGLLVLDLVLVRLMVRVRVGVIVLVFVTVADFEAVGVLDFVAVFDADTPTAGVLVAVAEETTTPVFDGLGVGVGGVPAAAQ